jgi:hypothetical protein
MKQTAVLTPAPPAAILGDRPRGKIEMLGTILDLDRHHEQYEYFVRSLAQKDLNAVIGVNFINGEESVKALHRAAFSKCCAGGYQLIREFKGCQGERDYLWIGQQALIDAIKTAAWKQYPEGAAQGVLTGRLIVNINRTGEPDLISGFQVMGTNEVWSTFGSGKTLGNN